MNKPERSKLGIKPKHWSHDDHFRALKGKRIHLRMQSGAVFRGVLLVEADRFSLFVREAGNDHLIFKHAISMVTEDV